jgi:hypothetical protein
VGKVLSLKLQCSIALLSLLGFFSIEIKAAQGDFYFLQEALKDDRGRLILLRGTLVQLIDEGPSTKIKPFKRMGGTWAPQNDKVLSHSIWDRVAKRAAPSSVCPSPSIGNQLAKQTTAIVTRAEAKLTSQTSMSSERTSSSRLQENINWMVSLHLSNESPGQAKLDLIQKMKERTQAKTMTEKEASDLLLTMTLFGELRGGRVKKSGGKEITEFFPRNPAHLFWMTKVLEGRLNTGEKRFSKRRVSIYLPQIADHEDGTIDWLSRSIGGVALAQNQLSSWNATSSNKNLAVMLDPSREGEAGKQALNEIITFVNDYRGGQYEIMGEDPHICSYDSPSCYFSLLQMEGKSYDELSAKLIETKRAKFNPVALPVIRNKRTGKEYAVDGRAFIGGN